MMEERPFAPPKRYEKTGGFWTPGPDSRVLLFGERRDELSGLVSLLEEEYPALVAMARVEEEPPRPGDVALCLGRPEELAGAETFREGYVLRVGQWVELTAQSLRGAVYGLRRMMELAGEGGVPRGTLADWPDSGERALHLDMGRKHYTPEWIARRIRDMSRNRMNTLWLHFSETEGFRIACDSHPEVPSLLYHSKEEIRGLIRLANAYQIDVNPSLDSPGHLGQALREHPRWQLPRRDGSRLHSALDITNPDAVGFFRDLLDEYMDLFSGSKVFHIGGDEFIDFRDFSPYPVMDAWAKERLGPEYTGVDTYVHYLNEITARVRAEDFQVRVWNDGLYRTDVNQRLELDRDVQIAYWSRWDGNMASLSAFLDRGHRVVNYHSGYLYYILLTEEWYTDPDGTRILSRWAPDLFPDSDSRGGGQGQRLPENRRDLLLGCAFSVWSDWPHLQKEEEVEMRSRDAMRAMGMRCWAWK